MSERNRDRWDRARGLIQDVWDELAVYNGSSARNISNPAQSHLSGRTPRNTSIVPLSYSDESLPSNLPRNTNHAPQSYPGGCTPRNSCNAPQGYPDESTQLGHTTNAPQSYLDESLPSNLPRNINHAPQNYPSGCTPRNNSNAPQSYRDDSTPRNVNNSLDAFGRGSAGRSSSLALQGHSQINTASSRSFGRQELSMQEHSKIFGYQQPLFSKGKRSKSSNKFVKKAKRGIQTYTKETVCVRKHNQTWIPTTQDRIQLGRIGLGLKKLVFDVEGDAQHIHQVIIAAYPVLSECGGYSLMRLSENSRALIRIDAPSGGMTIPFLRDILRQAKLFVRPLQVDISLEEAKKYCSAKESVEPEEPCMMCNEYFPLSILEKHVASKCCQKQTDVETNNQLYANGDKYFNQNDLVEHPGNFWSEPLTSATNSQISPVPRSSAPDTPTAEISTASPPICTTVVSVFSGNTVSLGGNASALSGSAVVPPIVSVFSGNAVSIAGNTVSLAQSPFSSADYSCPAIPTSATMMSTLSQSPPLPSAANIVQCGSTDSFYLERALTSATVVGNSTYSDFVNLISDDEEDINWDDEKQLQAAIDASLLESNPSIRGVPIMDKKLSEVLAEHHNKLLHSDQTKTHRITVRRTVLWQDALKSFKRKFDTKCHLRITFLGEPAVDDGGPRREFFMLLMAAMKSQEDLFAGSDDRRVLRHNVRALEEGVFLVIGKMIALSIIHGGPGPVFFANPVIDYLFGIQAKFAASVEDIPDYTIRTKMNKLQACQDENELKALMDSPDYEFRFDSGLSQATYCIKFEDKEAIVQSLCRHYSVYAAAPEMQQLLKGLETLEFLDLMRTYPTVLRQAFIPATQPITADFIQDLFIPEYSVIGSNKRMEEESIVMNWINYLHDMEDAEPCEHPCDDDKVCPSIEDVFIFLTGCDQVPPLGFLGCTPAIKFDDSLQVPRVSTCSLTLYFPLKMMPSEYNVFKEKMDFYILGSQGFGQI